MKYSDDWFTRLDELIVRADAHGDASGFRPHQSTDRDMLRLAMQVHRERMRQAGKFALSNRMWFTSEAAQQASSDAVAAYHASLYPADVPVIDAGCGIGSDTIALARRGPVIAVEMDRLRCAMARRNLLVHELADRVTIICADMTTLRWSNADWVFFDPARRREGVRKPSPDDWSPPLTWLVSLAECMRGAIIKVSPTLDARTAPSGWSVDCVGWDGACRECLWRFGECAGPNRVQAVSLPSGQILDASIPEPQPTATRTRWVYAPFPEVLAARATGALCRLLNGSPLGKASHLIGSEHLHPTVFARAYRALDWFAWRERTARQYIARHGGSVIAVKPHGVRLDTNELSRRLSRNDGRPLTLQVYRDNQRLLAVLTEPVC